MSCCIRLKNKVSFRMMLNFYEYVEKIISISNISEVGGGDRSTGNRWCQIMHRRELVIIIMVMYIMTMHSRKHHHADAWCVCISICISHEKEEGSYWICLNKHGSSLKHPILLFLWHSGKHWHIGWLPLISSAQGIALQKIEYCTNELVQCSLQWTLQRSKRSCCVIRDQAYCCWRIYHTICKGKKHFSGHWWTISRKMKHIGGGRYGGMRVDRHVHWCLWYIHNCRPRHEDDNWGSNGKFWQVVILNYFCDIENVHIIPCCWKKLLLEQI